MIGEMVLRGKWHHCVSLARWPVLPRHPTCFTTASLPSEWCSEHAGQQLPRLCPALLPLSRANELSTALRKWQHLIVDGNVDDELQDGDRMQLRTFVTDLEKHKMAMNPAAYEPERQRIKLPAARLVSQILASLDLRNRGRLRQVALRCIQATLPGTFVEVCKPWIEQLSVSRGSLERGRLLLDLAMMRLTAKRMASIGAVLRYGWGDSTVKAGRDWYNTKSRYVPRDAILQLSRASKFLSMHPPQQDARAGDDDGAGALAEGFMPDNTQDTVAHRERCKHSQYIFDMVNIHTSPPQQLGQGRTSLVHKVGACLCCLRQLALQIPSSKVIETVDTGSLPTED